MVVEWSDAKEVRVLLEKEADEAIGLVPNDNLIIVSVQKGSHAEGKLFVGDRVLKVNDVAVNDMEELHRALQKSNTATELLVLRDRKKAEELEARVNVPAERAKFIMRREGFSYLMARLQVMYEMKLGFSIMGFQNRVLVSRVEPNSAADGQLMVCDHLIDVDGMPVSDKEVCKQLISRGLRRNGFFTSVIERPESKEAKLWCKSALIAAADISTSPSCGVDVQEIASKQLEKMKADVKPQKPAVIAPPAPRHVSIASEEPRVFTVGSEKKPKGPLRPA